MRTYTTKNADADVVVEFLRYQDLVQRNIIRNRTTLGRWIKAGVFPKPVKLGKYTIAWRVTDINAWARGLEYTTSKAASSNE